MLNSRFALLGNDFYSKDETKYSFENVIAAKDFILLYFGAYYSPASTKFTDFLQMFYYEINSFEKQVEVVYVNSDRNYQEFRKHMDSMPWLCLPY